MINNVLNNYIKLSKIMKMSKLVRKIMLPLFLINCLSFTPFVFGKYSTEDSDVSTLKNKQLIKNKIQQHKNMYYLSKQKSPLRKVKFNSIKKNSLNNFYNRINSPRLIINQRKTKKGEKRLQDKKLFSGNLNVLLISFIIFILTIVIILGYLLLFSIAPDKKAKQKQKIYRYTNSHMFSDREVLKFLQDKKKF